VLQCSIRLRSRRWSFGLVMLLLCFIIWRGSCCSVPVLDRVGLIIEIFAQRARSREARLQVSHRCSVYSPVLMNPTLIWPNLHRLR
jgi:hypothetical protein